MQNYIELFQDLTGSKQPIKSTGTDTIIYNYRIISPVVSTFIMSLMSPRNSAMTTGYHWPSGAWVQEIQAWATQNQ